MLDILKFYAYFAGVILPVVVLYGYIWERQGRLAERKVLLLAAVISEQEDVRVTYAASVGAARIAEQDALILKLQDALRARA